MFRNLPIVTLDFETYFSATYGLKLKAYNTSGYIRDPQFKAQCVGIKVGDADVVWYRDVHVDAALRQIDWKNVALLCHNGAFDGFILSDRYGIVPAYYLDTLSMARAIHSNSILANLDAVCTFYGVGNKLPDVLDRTKGIRELPEDLMISLGQYCAVDTELCRLIFDKMRVGFPEAEFDQIDLTLRMFNEPVLNVDLPRAQKALDEEILERGRLIAESGLTLKELGQNEMLAQALRTADPNIVVPTKWSAKQKKTVYAFAKGDLDFMELAEDHNPAVRALVKGRIAAKSTIGETRAIRFLKAGENGAKLPVMLKYCGAHTTRWSAGNKMNMQNLKRGGELRKCVLAPPGFQIVACDSSQIEARVLAWLADHYVMLQAFRDWDEGTGPDVYKIMASVIYNKPIDQITKEERFVGKVVVLAAGYGMGADKYEYTLAAGSMGPPVIVPNDKCWEIIKAFRLKNAPYPTLWNKMEMMLVRMVSRSPTSLKMLEITKDHSILLPNGLYLNYPGLTADFDPNEERYSNFKYYTLDQQKILKVGGEVKGKKIYGGLLTENVVQALARIIVADQMLAISKELKVVTMTHDEVVCIVPDRDVLDAEQFMLTEMRKTPSWAPDLPLNAEAEHGVCYG
jgi:DNA polymerase family A